MEGHNLGRHTEICESSVRAESGDDASRRSMAGTLLAKTSLIPQPQQGARP